jgi:hypothetical protein
MSFIFRIQKKININLFPKVEVVNIAHYFKALHPNIFRRGVSGTTKIYLNIKGQNNTDCVSSNFLSFQVIESLGWF